MSTGKTYSEADRSAEVQALISKPRHYDLVVVGGGITGAGILREAAARGLEVLLVEQQDFAWGTSSRSSKMVHGGLRYLGKGQFGLANDSVKERQNLIQQLPGLVDVLPFAMNHYKGKFPGPWIFDKLLAIYDFMAGKRYRRFVASGVGDYWLPGVREEQLMGATLFADAVTDDSALVMRVISEARRYGGVALNYVKATGITSPSKIASSTSNASGSANVDQSKSSQGGGKKSHRVLTLCDMETEQSFQVTANAVINATGAWTDQLRACLGQSKRIRPLRGSHVVVPFWRLPVAFSVTFFHPEDKRPVFVFPWEGQTVIGTTDLDHRASLDQEARMTKQEMDYLFAAANSQFSNANLSCHDVISSWSGVRPVVVDEGMAEQPNAAPSDEKREHEIWDDEGLISIAGGKLTTFRLLALETLDKAVPYLQGKLTPEDLKHARNFPDLETLDSDNDELALAKRHLSAQQQKRLLARYGVELPRLLSELGTSFEGIEGVESELQAISVTDTLWAELRWMCQLGSVVHLDDLLLRRTRIGLLIKNGADVLLPQIKAYLSEVMPWDERRWQSEIERYRNVIKEHYSLPKESLAGENVDA